MTLRVHDIGFLQKFWRPFPLAVTFFLNYVESCKGRGERWGEVKARIVSNPAKMMMKALKSAEVESRQMCL